MEGVTDPHAPARIEDALLPVRTNWSGNYTFRAPQLLEPGTVAAVQEAVRAARQVKAVGSRHSFNHIADTDGTQLAGTHLKAMSLDREAAVVAVGAGVTYGELAPWLHAQGFAVHNLASLPHISVAGACATATHGSGLGNGCLATAVVGLDFVNGTGEHVQLRAAGDPEALRCAAAGIGAFGVVTATHLRVEPTFQVAQMVYEELPFRTLLAQLPEVFGAAYSVSVFTDWQAARATQVWVKQRLAEGETPMFAESLFGARRQTRKLHPLPGISAESCTEQEGVAGPWYERLPHFRLDYTPSAGAELQTEYFVPFERAGEAILAVEALHERIAPHLLISELRTVAADELPMSMCLRRQGLGLHFTWKQEQAAVEALLPALEEALAPFDARPHWGKLFTMAPDRVRGLYPELARFEAFVRAHDPEAKFRNGYLRALLG